MSFFAPAHIALTGLLQANSGANVGDKFLFGKKISTKIQRQEHGSIILRDRRTD